MRAVINLGDNGKIEFSFARRGICKYVVQLKIISRIVRRVAFIIFYTDSVDKIEINLNFVHVAFLIFNCIFIGQGDTARGQKITCRFQLQCHVFK